MTDQRQNNLAVSASRIRELFDYSEGMLFWRRRPRSEFSNAQAFLAWNIRFFGKPAGCVASQRGGSRRRVAITINGITKKYLASRLIWAWCHRRWPVGLVDHENGDTLDDRIENLRDVSTAVNGQNARRAANNTSGITGVSKTARGGRWQSYIQANGEKKNLGVFETLSDAVVARKAAERRHGFHANHGRSR